MKGEIKVYCYACNESSQSTVSFTLFQLSMYSQSDNDRLIKELENAYWESYKSIRGRVNALERSEVSRQ